ncbi:fatty acid desaturase 6-like [Mizuhopecten yessoensis]|uniref:Fatty acid desaturase 6 n=1 Tax=Mizuhopecten yessoensis TaxID=6573 RepID=A0A210Q5G8_MIZYE|nr:fatty acid desaturase 6-like [Mizuhopecten yessoensis]OWF43961.1 Fatty acid desaturase 6 [Mizuhopecten yessoensis]
MVGYFGGDRGQSKDVYDEVELKDLPKMVDLRKEVNSILQKSSWWDLYGVDWVITFVVFGMVFVAVYLMSFDSALAVALGILIYGYCHSSITVKGAHAATHGSVCASTAWNRVWMILFSDIVGSFPSDATYDIHIKTHHPHTNIIGLGDSSTWKIPFLPTYAYMYVAPLFIPVITIPVSISELWGKWFKMIKYLVFTAIGLSINFYFLMNMSGFTFTHALLVTWVARAMLSIPYIHVNIFQHIGLPMYSQKSRPVRIYQMSTGVLNLPRNLILDYSFGHSILSCHVEHHLFPTLSDNMCLKIQPTVSRFLKKNGLPYNEDTYQGRLEIFTKKYKELMVNAPPITHFVGIQ